MKIVIVSGTKLIGWMFAASMDYRPVAAAPNAGVYIVACQGSRVRPGTTTLDCIACEPCLRNAETPRDLSAASGLCFPLMPCSAPANSPLASAPHPPLPVVAFPIVLGWLLLHCAIGDDCSSLLTPPDQHHGGREDAGKLSATCRTPSSQCREAALPDGSNGVGWQ